MTFLELAEAVLKKAETPLNYKEMWESAKVMGLDKQVNSTGQTPWQTMQALMYVNMRDKADSTKFFIASKRPTTFWLKEREKELSKPNAQVQNTTTQNIESKKQKETFCERDLHPLLVYFLANDEGFSLHSKTIFHERCTRKEQGRSKWNYPDIVGVKFPFSREIETLDLLANINQSEYKLYSFELKKSIDFSNLKEYYFQAVSNSSFANEGYLVVFEYIDKEVLGELKRLNASFGIGVIQLKADVLDSEVVLPATQRNLDIETLNMLVEESPCFKEFIKDINEHIRAKKQNLDYTKDKFDKILKDEYEVETYKAKYNIAE
ncbi:HTH domain-containing protein [Helicobacter sp. 23-1048]